MSIEIRENSIVFTNLVESNREFGSTESLTRHSPAEMSAAPNAVGVFEMKSFEAINLSAEAAGKNIRKIFGDS